MACIFARERRCVSRTAIRPKMSIEVGLVVLPQLVQRVQLKQKFHVPLRTMVKIIYLV